MTRTREKLIELLDEVMTEWGSYLDSCLDEEKTPEHTFFCFIADYLISNGVRLELKQATSDENKRWMPLPEMQKEE